MKFAAKLCREIFLEQLNGFRDCFIMAQLHLSFPRFFRLSNIELILTTGCNVILTEF